MKLSTEIKDIAGAISIVQTENKGAEIGASNPFFKSKYSTLENVWNAIQRFLAPNGLAVVQDVQSKETCVSITTLVMHKSGQWIEFGPFDMPLAKKDAHSIGSAVKYGRRYALCAAFSIVGESDDDDGNEAMPKPEKKACISQEQLETLIDIIGSDEEYRETLLGFYKIKTLAEIEALKYPSILKSATKRKENRKKAEEQNGL